MAAKSKYIVFRNKYYPYAVKATAGTKIFPDTVIAAAAVESAYGNSKLTKETNNFFGVKGTPGKIYRTRENKDGKNYYINASFKIYRSPEESFKDYVNFVQGKRYVEKGVLSAKNPTEQIKRIAAAGYATDPNYFKIVSSFIQQNKKPIITGLGLLGLSLGIWAASTK